MTPHAPFTALPLAAPLRAVLATQGIDIPTPIQAATLPDAISGRDVLGRAQTGSGKTLAFGLALLTRLAGERAKAGAPLAVVLVPTRELATQVSTALTPYAAAVRLRVATVVGGLPIHRQIDSLRRGVEIVVATPGRLGDLLERGDCRLGDVAVTVLDEADQMADMGFMPQVSAILEQTPEQSQRMLFSATLDGEVDTLVRRFLTEPARHSTDPPAGSVTTMEHHLLHVEHADKNSTAAEIGARTGRVIMFVGTRHRADRLTKHLLGSGVRAAALHGGKSQPQRTKILDRFRTGAVNALIATDVAARGIHIDDLDLVVNVDPPGDAKDYLHRSGRTARAGRSGTVVTLVLPNQRRETTRLLAAAGVAAASARVRPGDTELTRITGARTPSGVPVEEGAITGAPPARAARAGGARTGGPGAGSPRAGGPRAGGARTGGAWAGNARPGAAAGRTARAGAQRGEVASEQPVTQSTGGRGRPAAAQPLNRETRRATRFGESPARRGAGARTAEGRPSRSARHASGTPGQRRHAG